MHKDLVPPISIEEFAAYLDGNLSDDDVRRVSSVIENDEAMQDIAVNNQLVEETLSNYESSDFILPEELTSLDFEVPLFDDSVNINNTWDGLDAAACVAETTPYEPSECDDTTVPFHEGNVVIHHEDCIGDVSDGVNNDITQEHNDFENDISEIND